MVEVVRGVAVHPEALHHPARRHVGRDGERHDLVETGAFESEGHGRGRSLRRVALAPGVCGQAPADLDARREVRLEAGHGASR